MLSQAVRDELKAELDHLRAERERAIARFDSKIAALEAILEDVPAQTTLPLGDQRVASNGHAGFRDTVLGILKAYPSGLRSSDMAQKLEAVGFKPGGSSPLLRRVHGEMYRLMLAGRIQRRGHKYYLAPPRETDAP
jgi:hypothetical protein